MQGFCLSWSTVQCKCRLWDSVFPFSRNSCTFNGIACHLSIKGQGGAVIVKVLYGVLFVVESSLIYASCTVTSRLTQTRAEPVQRITSISLGSSIS